MKKQFLSFAASSILVATLTINVFAAPAINFKDVPKSYWAHDLITQTTEDGYFKGYPDGKFLPNKQITRAEFISLFDNIVKKNFTISQSVEDKTLLQKISPYKDVSSNQWFYSSVKDLWFYGSVFDTTNQSTRNNIDLIFGKDKLIPNQPITRAEVSELLYKLVDDTQIKASLLPEFRDCTNHKFKYSIRVLNSFGIINGYPDNTFRPNQSIKRSEAASMIKKLLDTKRSFKKIVWTPSKQYSYDQTLTTPVDVVKKVIQLELDSKFDEAYIYISDSSIKSLNLNNYKDYMRTTSLHVSKDLAYWTWDRVNVWTEFTTLEDNADEVKIKYVYTLEDETTKEGIITLAKNNYKWFIILNNK